MKMYEVVGVERISGNSKKTGQPFSMTRLHLVYDDPSNKNLGGRGVESIVPYDNVLAACKYNPTVGDFITLNYEPGFDGRARLVSIEHVG